MDAVVIEVPANENPVKLSEDDKKRFAMYFCHPMRGVMGGTVNMISEGYGLKDISVVCGTASEMLDYSSAQWRQLAHEFALSGDNDSATMALTLRGYFFADTREECMTMILLLRTPTAGATAQ